MSGSGYALAVLFAINLMNFFDRQIIGGVGEGIRREWALTDTALGLLATVFTLLYAVVGLPLGRLSDRVERRKILAVGVFAWSVLTAFSGMTRSFGQLIVARLGVGVGEATCSPASTSLIGDLVRPTERARAIAIWMLGLPLGLGLANGAGGWILQNWGWRNAFYIAAVPGILCAIAALMMREPARGTREVHAVGDVAPRHRGVLHDHRVLACRGREAADRGDGVVGRLRGADDLVGRAARAEAQSDSTAGSKRRQLHDLATRLQL